MGEALGKIYNTPAPADIDVEPVNVDVARIRKIINSSSNGYLTPADVQTLMDACDIPRVKEFVVDNSYNFV